VCLGSDVSCALRCDLEVVKSREEEIGRPLLHRRFSQNTISRQPIRTLRSQIQENKYFNLSLYQFTIEPKSKTIISQSSTRTTGYAVFRVLTVDHSQTYKAQYLDVGGNLMDWHKKSNISIARLPHSTSSHDLPTTSSRLLSQRETQASRVRYAMRELNSRDVDKTPNSIKSTYIVRSQCRYLIA
jgi:hypothetical protein